MRSSPPNTWHPFRPLGTGVVHGMAGSAAVVLLVPASIRDPLSGIAYLGVFGLGTIVGMWVITSALAIPVLVVSQRCERLRGAVGTVAGLGSFAFGVSLIREVGFVHGLLTGHPQWTPQ